MKMTDLLFGRSLATEEEKAERIGPLKGIPIFGLDALSAAAMVRRSLVESHWYHYLLHNNRPEAIRALLLFNGNQRITLASMPYYLNA